MSKVSTGTEGSPVLDRLLDRTLRPGELLDALRDERQFIEELVDLVKQGLLAIDDSACGPERYVLTARGRARLPRCGGAR